MSVFCYLSFARQAGTTATALSGSGLHTGRASIRKVGSKNWGELDAFRLGGSSTDLVSMLLHGDRPGKPSHQTHLMSPCTRPPAGSERLLSPVRHEDDVFSVIGPVIIVLLFYMFHFVLFNVPFICHYFTFYGKSASQPRASKYTQNAEFDKRSIL